MFVDGVFIKGKIEWVDGMVYEGEFQEGVLIQGKI